MSISYVQSIKKDLDSLVQAGFDLCTLMQMLWNSGDFTASKKDRQRVKDRWGTEFPIQVLVYNQWYTKALYVVKQLIPERLNDFVDHYQPPKARRCIDVLNYRIEDALTGKTATQGGRVITDPRYAIPHMKQQLAIVASAKDRFISTLFNIRQLLQADLFDSELDGAAELNRNGYFRAAGAVAGVVLEGHLKQLSTDRGVTYKKKILHLSDYNDGLKQAAVYDTAQWRQIQYLGDIRNKCDHRKEEDPTEDQIKELIDGVRKVIKNVF